MPPRRHSARYFWDTTLAQAVLTLARSQAPAGSRRIRPALPWLGAPASRSPEAGGQVPDCCPCASTQAPASQVPNSSIAIDLFCLLFAAANEAFVGSSKLPTRSAKMSPRLQSQIARVAESRRSPPSSPGRPRSTRCLLGSRRSATTTSATAQTRSPGRHAERPGALRRPARSAPLTRAFDEGERAA